MNVCELDEYLNLAAEIWTGKKFVIAVLGRHS